LRDELARETQQRVLLRGIIRELRAGHDKREREMLSQRMRLSTEREDYRGRIEQLEGHVERLRGEKEQAAAETELLREFMQRERDLLQQRHGQLLEQEEALDSATRSIRRTDELLTEQKQLYQEELGRYADQRGQMAERIEELERECRAGVEKLQATRAELLRQEQLMAAAQSRAYHAGQEMARRAIDVEASEPEHTSMTLSRLEAQAERELRAWRDSRAGSP
jgi:hypothetical protein